MQAQFLYAPIGHGPHCHAATLLQTARRDLLAAWYVYPDKEHKDACLALARRTIGQEEWGPSERLFDTLHASVGNPVLFEDPQGLVWLLFVVLNGSYWNDAEIHGVWSSDGGYSWSTPMLLWHQRGMMVRHPPLVLESRALLLPAYDEIAKQTVLLSSQPPYQQWREAFRFMTPPLIQPVLVRRAPRRLTLFFRPTTDPRCIWRSHSSDDGTTWSSPIRTPLPNPLTGIAAFMVKDSIALVYNHTQEHQRHPLSIAVSDDSGTSWGEPWHLDAIPYEVSYPSFLCGPDGDIHGVYTYNRRMIKYISFPSERLTQRHGKN